MRLAPVLLLVRSAGDRRDAVWRSWLASTGFFTVLHCWLLSYLFVFAVPLAILFVLLPATWVTVELLRSWDRLGGSWGFLGLT